MNGGGRYYRPWNEQAAIFGRYGSGWRVAAFLVVWGVAFVGGLMWMAILP